MNWRVKMKSVKLRERQKGEPVNSTPFLCARRDLNRVRAELEQERMQYLKELPIYVQGCTIDIEITEQEFFLGWSFGGRLLVNGELCREYELIELLFLDLTYLMLKGMLPRDIPKQE